MSVTPLREYATYILLDEFAGGCLSFYLYETGRDIQMEVRWNKLVIAANNLDSLSMSARIKNECC